MGDLAHIKEGSSTGLREPDAVRDVLDEACRRIAGISRLTEELYISIGREVQEYSAEASGITQAALSVSEIISGDELKASMEGLSGMVDQFEDIFSRVETLSTSHLETLNAVAQRLGSMEEDLEGIAGTSKDLKMLALSTKIQSTRTGGDSAAFRHLGDDIAQMAIIISTKTGELFSESSALTGIVSSVNESLGHLRERQALQARNVLRWSRSIIDSMSDLSVRSKEEAERIRKTTEKITLNVSEMITSVQYQDISKQSLEKIVEELQNGLEDDPCQVPEAGEPPHGPREVPGEVRLTALYLRQISRLEKTGIMVRDSLEWMIRNMEGISADVHRMASISRIVYGDTSKFLGDLETTMSSVTTFLKEVVRSNRQMTGNMVTFGKTAEEMSQFIQDIEMISSEVELISLNASIMAAQAGQDGAGMGVIAEAVKDTARQSDGFRQAVVGRLSEILSVSAGLQYEVKDTTRSDEEKLDQLVRELGVFIDALRMVQKKVLSMLEAMDKRGGTLIQAVGTTVNDIRVHLSRESAFDDIVLRIKRLALDHSARIRSDDLLRLAGNRRDEIDPGTMGPQERLDLVNTFVEENLTESDISESMPGREKGEEALFFDDEN